MINFRNTVDLQSPDFGMSIRLKHGDIVFLDGARVHCQTSLAPGQFFDKENPRWSVSFFACKFLLARTFLTLLDWSATNTTEQMRSWTMGGTKPTWWPRLAPGPSCIGPSKCSKVRISMKNTAKKKTRIPKEQTPRKRAKETSEKGSKGETPKQSPKRVASKDSAMGESLKKSPKRVAFKDSAEKHADAFSQT